jgi:hypothetical protein
VRGSSNESTDVPAGPAIPTLCVNALHEKATRRLRLGRIPRHVTRRDVIAKNWPTSDCVAKAYITRLLYVAKSPLAIDRFHRGYSDGVRQHRQKRVSDVDFDFLRNDGVAGTRNARVSFCPRGSREGYW